MAKVIMVQGTMSNAGKSWVVAGLCRIFRQDGYHVAPFKSQNMALNSFITKEGLEMGRAQVMQCEAAGIEPSVQMNPILLKPTNEIGSQVILNGEVIGNFSAKEYFQKKKDFLPEIKKAYDVLAEKYDIIVIEGAGSPAEINLKKDDIVNMGMAELADAPVILIGDIDRGGVFAQLVGTMMLLEKKEQNRIKGFVINKFRGDVTLLQSGITMLEEKYQKKVLGVIPYLSIDIEDEDSLSQRFEKKEKRGLLDIAVIHFPHISNFTDFNRLEAIEGICLRYVKKTSELKWPDMIILPGTKNTIEDLLFIRQEGLESAIKKLSQKGVIVFGICGGYQMMGNLLSDPYGIEKKGTIRGMQLLPIKTIFEKEKTRTRVKGRFLTVFGDLKELSEKIFWGYEIHMGKTEIEKGQPFTQIVKENKDDQIDGVQNQNCYGTYVHGIFDAEETVQALIKALCQKKNIDCTDILKNTVNWQAYKQKQYDLLADTIRSSLDMQEIYKILEGDR